MVLYYIFEVLEIGSILIAVANVILTLVILSAFFINYDKLIIKYLVFYATIMLFMSLSWVYLIVLITAEQHPHWILWSLFIFVNFATLFINTYVLRNKKKYRIAGEKK